MIQQLEQAGNMYGFNGKDRWAHGGMLKAALHIRNELQKSGVLTKFLGHYTSSHSTIDTPLTQVG